jgi:GNAT superfamily N-acetyltransferase
VNILPANASDNYDLTVLTKLSKAYWGYSKQQINAWSDDLTITSKYIEENEVYKLVLDKKIIGYYSYFKIEEQTVLLDNIFILPKYIGKGYGKTLMHDLFKRIEKDGFSIIRLYSEPKAELFYQKLGFVHKGEYHSKISDRYLAIMEMDLTSRYPRA